MAAAVETIALGDRLAWLRAEHAHDPQIQIIGIPCDAAEQTRRENAAAAAGSPVLICDTDAFATAIWERRYLGGRSRSDQPWTRVPPRAVYLVTDHNDVAWHDDGLREGDMAIRAAMTRWFTTALTAAGHSWVLLTGGRAERLDIATRTIDPLVANRAQFGKPLHGPGFEHHL